MFRRPIVRYGKTPEPETPYQRAGQVWDDRIGSARVQAKNWRLAFFAALALSGGLAGGLVWQSARGTITPWVVQVDQARPGRRPSRRPSPTIGRPIRRSPGTWPASSRRCAASRPIRSCCARIGSTPTITSPTRARSHSTITRGPTTPSPRSAKTQVSIEIASVIRASDDSFRVEWVERRYVDDALASTERWSAILTVVVQTPTDADRLKKNPLGVYVHALNWSKELG